MEGEKLSVKIEPEEDLENDLHQGDALEDEKKTEDYLPIKPEVILEEDIHSYQSPEFEFVSIPINLPSIKVELDTYPNKSRCIQMTSSNNDFSEEEKKGNSLNYNCTKIRSTCLVDDCLKQEMKGGYCKLHGNKPICKEDACPKCPVKDGYRAKHGGIVDRSTCKEDTCPKWAVKGGYCVKHGGIVVRYTCKEDACPKWAVKGGYCREHSGIVVKYTCKEDACPKRAVKEGYCVKHGGTVLKSACKEDTCPNWAVKGGSLDLPRMEVSQDLLSSTGQAPSLYELDISGMFGLGSGRVQSMLLKNIIGQLHRKEGAQLS
uniref:(California timema) hypothetical protein n=1 Tax=Timema californicum TaxID=61474 RepID=A0A7R9J4L6_TIMCA|nr:unnamed protein product [Timema californicum]